MQTDGAAAGLMLKGTINDLAGTNVVVHMIPNRAAGMEHRDDFRHEFRGITKDCRLVNSESALEQWDGNIASLQHASDDAVVDALRYRWVHGPSYVQLPGAHVWINPLGSGSPLQSAQRPQPVKLDRLPKADAGMVETLARKAMRQRQLLGRCCAFVLNGESGAGKSSLARQLLGCGGGGEGGPSDQALATVKVLEAFGNARTLSNDDASRCATFWQIWPADRFAHGENDRRGAVTTTHFLLDSPRVTSRHEQERNFNIFYQMIAGLETAERNKLKLMTVDEYDCLAGRVKTSGKKDGRQFKEETVPALKQLGFDETMQRALWQALVGVLASANVDQSRREDVDWIAVAAEALGIETAALTDRLTVCGVSIPSGARQSGPGKAMASVKPQALACGLYAGLFSWLMHRISSLTCPVLPSEPWVGIVDFIGSEKLATNSLEQLLANHSSEHLHGLYLKFCILEEEAMAMKGCPEMKRVVLDETPDLLQMVDGSVQKKGIIDILDKQVGESNEGQFVKAVSDAFGEQPVFRQGRDTHTFRIMHTFRSVEYDSTGFLERNRHVIEKGSDLASLLSRSSNPVIKEAFTDSLWSRRSTTNSVAAGVRDQLRTLERQLCSGKADLHFIHCIRPNWASSSSLSSDGLGAFDWDCVQFACKSLEVFAAVHLQRQKLLNAAFSYRRRHADFLMDFTPLLFPNSWRDVKTDPVAVIEALLKTAPPNSYSIGPLFVMLSAPVLKVLEERKTEARQRLDGMAGELQGALRAMALQADFQAKREDRLRLVAPLQAMVRRRLEISGTLHQKKIAAQVLGVVRLLQAAELIKPKITAAMIIQRRARGGQARTKLEDRRREIMASKRMKALVHTMHLRQKVYMQVLTWAADVIAVRWRGYMCRKTLLDLRRKHVGRRRLLAVIATLKQRCMFMASQSEQAATVLQSKQRGIMDRNLCSSKRQQALSQRQFMGVLKTCVMRQRLQSQLEHRAVYELQRFWKKKRAIKRYVEKQATDDAWAVVAPCLSAFQMRLRFVGHRQAMAARILSQFRHRTRSRRQIHFSCIKRLQDLLGGVYHSWLAGRLLQRLHDNDERMRASSGVCAALQAVAVRIKFAQHVRSTKDAASLQVQNAFRGASTRRGFMLIKMKQAQAQLVADCRRYLAWSELHRIKGEAHSGNSRDTVDDCLETLVARLRHAAQLHRVKAARILTKHAHGFIGRIRVRRLRRATASVMIGQTLEGLHRSYQARMHLLKLRQEQEIERAIATWTAVVTTFQWRYVFALQREEAGREDAKRLLESMVAGIVARRGGQHKAVQAAMQRVRRELADERQSKRHMAAMRIQSAWRRMLSVSEELLPQLCSRLFSERSELHNRAQSEFAVLDSLMVGQQYAVAVRPLREVRSKNVKFVAPDGSEGWLVTATSAGEGFLEIGFGSNFIVGVVANGTAKLFVAGESGPTTFSYNTIYQKAMRPVQPPRIRNVSCGEGHVLFVSDQGMVYAWGDNSHGQCGLGSRGDADVVFPEVSQPICLHTWSSHGKFEDFEEPDNRSGSGGLTRVETVTCGREASAAITLRGGLWLWGNEKQVALPRIKMVPKSGGAPVPPFLLFSHQVENVAASEEAAAKARPTSLPLGRAPAGAGPKAAAAREPASPCSQGTEDDESSVSAAAAKAGAATCAQLVRTALDGLVAEVVPGDLPAPTLCGTIISPCRGLSRGRGEGFVQLPTLRNDLNAAFVPAKIHGATFAEVTFGPQGANFVVSSKHRLCSWGAPGAESLLGRPAPAGAEPGETLAPARLPVLTRLSVSIKSVAVGAAHASLVTQHGRIFTWGQLEVCLGAEGFAKRCFPEPVYVEGKLRDMRVLSVAAGSTETVVSTSEGILGWEMLEAEAQGRKFVPVLYYYTRSIKATKLTMPGCEHLQVLLAAPDAAAKALSPAASPTSRAAALSLTASPVGSPARRAPPFDAADASPASFSPGKMSTARSLYQTLGPTSAKAAAKAAPPTLSTSEWHAANDKDLEKEEEDFRTRPRAMSDIGIRALVAPRELAELDRSVAGFRRLAGVRGKRKAK